MSSVSHKLNLNDGNAALKCMSVIASNEKNMNQILRQLIQWLVCLFVLSMTVAQAQTARPNVIIILSDDQGYGDISAHGNPALKTPNLDKLHHESVRLTDFHVAPMCTPTRGQLMTGVNALRNGATSVTAGRSLLRPGFPTMAEIFKGGGYRTALFGKWHLGDSYPNLPHHRGFDEAVYHMGWGVMSVAEPWLNDNFDDFYYHNGRLEQYKGYCTDVWFDLSMKWMKERRERNEPFFLYLPTNAPHGPAWVPRQLRVCAATLAQGGRHRNHRGRARSEVDRWRLLRGQGVADRQSAIEDRRFRSDPAGRSDRQNSYLHRPTQDYRQAANANVVL
jgi:arylsulfatase A-like enzyme